MMPSALSEERLIIGSARLLRALIDARGPIETPPRQRVSIGGLMRHAAVLGGVSAEEMFGRGRPARLARLRHAVALAAVEQPVSLSRIGKAMGNRDHSTVYNSLRSGEALAKEDPEFAWFVERLCAAGECEPFGPPSYLLPPPPMPAVADEPAAPPRAAVPPLSRRHRAAAPPVVPVKSEPGEYVPRHALPPVRADDGPPCVEEDREEMLIRLEARAASRALIDALRREHPERFEREAA